MKEIKVTHNETTGYWVVSIDGTDAMRARTLEKLAKTLYKWAKGQSL